MAALNTRKSRPNSAPVTEQSRATAVSLNSHPLWNQNSQFALLLCVLLLSPGLEIHHHHHHFRCSWPSTPTWTSTWALADDTPFLYKLSASSFSLRVTLFAPCCRNSSSSPPPSSRPPPPLHPLVPYCVPSQHCVVLALAILATTTITWSFSSLLFLFSKFETLTLPI